MSKQGRDFWALIGALLLMLLLNGCGTPGGAPVESRSTKPTPVAKTGFYRVRRGDTLYSIAWKRGLDYRKLAKWNRIGPPYRIYPGQRLRLKAPAPPVSPQKKSPPPSKKRPVVAKNERAKTKSSANAPNQPSGDLKKEKSAAIKSSPSSNRRKRWQWPAKGKVVQRFSSRDPTRKGLKIEGRLGQPIFAAEAGKVVYSGSGLIGYGPLIIIKHDKDYLSAYGHNRRLLVKEGDEVERGERIAEMGLAGGGKSVLHFEIRRKGKPINPASLLPKLPR